MNREGGRVRRHVHGRVDKRMDSAVFERWRMRPRIALFILFALSVLAFAAKTVAASTWGANYFPNVALTSQDGRQYRFFDDLIEDKVVVINFIYTRCVDSCPLETAHLVKVAQILGDRMGQDVFFYSITIDPENDTPEVLREYANRFQANWPFLTGKAGDIKILRQKLGLYIDAIQDGSNNHNLSMIIGNQRTGQWRKSSPFENPYIAAETIGQWLSGWSRPAAGNDYADAPQLRNLSRGEQLFRTRCVTCHSIAGSDQADLIGPDLAGVTQLRDRRWLIDWLRAPDTMLAEGDPIALELLEQYNNVAMPNMRLNQVDVMALIEYMGAESDRLESRPERLIHAVNAPQLHTNVSHQSDVLAVANARVNAAEQDNPATAGYVSLVNIRNEAVSLVRLESPAVRRVEMHEMAILEGLPAMQRIPSVTLEPGESIQFSPGSKHLMLDGLRYSLAPEQMLEIVLTFDSGETQVVPFTIVPARHMPRPSESHERPTRRDEWQQTDHVNDVPHVDQALHRHDSAHEH